jgi:hypothetical protein
LQRIGQGEIARRKSRFDDPDTFASYPSTAFRATDDEDTAWKAAARRQMDELARDRPAPTLPAEVPCSYCKGRYKKDRCTIRAHKDGCLISASVMNTNLVRRELEASGALGTTTPVQFQPAPASRPLSDRHLGIDTAQANEAAAEALLGAVCPAPAEECAEEPSVGTVGDGEADCVQGDQADAGATAAASDADRPAGTSAPRGDPPGLTGLAGPKRDDINVERARYASKHNQPHQDGSNSSGGAGRDGRTIIYSQKSGVWGGLKSLPPAAKWSSSGGSGGEGGAPRELLRLGEREDDPRKRLEQTRRTSLGAFAHAAAIEAAKQRHNPPSASMRPAKSALKNGTGRDGASSSSSLEDGEVTHTSASDAPAAPRPVKWVDMAGQLLCTQYTYEGAYDSPADGSAGSGLAVN